jgi:hypothetical protein
MQGKASSAGNQLEGKAPYRAIEELFPGLSKALTARQDSTDPWTEREGRFYHVEEGKYLYPESETNDVAHEQDIFECWLENIECHQSVDSVALLEILRGAGNEWKKTRAHELKELSIATIHDSADDLQTNWACHELLTFLSSNEISLNPSIRDYTGGLLLVLGIAQADVLAKAIEVTRPRITIIFEKDLDLLAKRINEEGCELLLQAIAYRKSQIFLIIEDNLDLAHRQAKAILETANLFCQEKIFSIEFRNEPWSKELLSRYHGGDSMIRDLRYLGFFVDELHMIMNSCIGFTQAAPRVITYGSAPRHSMHAVLTASGPSLDGELERIREYRDKFHLFCCYSTIGPLLDAGIKPDYHCNQERHNCHVPILAQPDVMEYAREAILLCTANNDPRMNRLYKESVAFFRSASCSSALFTHANGGWINGEGPQVANMALYYTLLLGYRTIHLFGVDLGSANPSQARSPKAISSSTRTLDRKAPGNRRPWIYTDQSLLDSAEFMHWLISGQLFTELDMLEGVTVFNYSDGLKIEGTIPSDPDEFGNNLQEHKPPSSTISLIQAIPTYNQELARAKILAFDWNEKLLEYWHALDELISTPLNRNTYEHFQQLSERQLNSFHDQVLPRLMAGTFSRIWFMIFAINERMPSLDAEVQAAWEQTAARILRGSASSMLELTTEMLDYVMGIQSIDEYQLRSCRGL